MKIERSLKPKETNEINEETVNIHKVENRTLELKDRESSSRKYAVHIHDIVDLK